MKKGLFIIALSSVLLLTGCGKAKKLECEYFSSEDSSRKVECTFNNGKALKCSLISEREYESESKAQEYKEAVSVIKNTEVKVEGKKTIVTSTINDYKDKTYDEIRKELKNGGYSCK